MKDKKFTLIDENGVKTTYSVLFTFENGCVITIKRDLMRRMKI